MAEIPAALVMREAGREDRVPVCDVLRSVGLSMPEAVRHLWQRPWVENPAVAMARQKRSPMPRQMRGKSRHDV
jgi:hypothetical protein